MTFSFTPTDWSNDENFLTMVFLFQLIYDCYDLFVDNQ